VAAGKVAWHGVPAALQCSRQHKRYCIPQAAAQEDVGGRNNLWKGEMLTGEGSHSLPSECFCLPF